MAKSKAAPARESYSNLDTLTELEQRVMTGLPNIGHQSIEDATAELRAMKGHDMGLAKEVARRLNRGDDAATVFSSMRHSIEIGGTGIESGEGGAVDSAPVKG